MLIPLWFAAFFLAPAPVTHALLSAYTVNTIADHADGACDAADCTLREAILAANAHPNGPTPDEISFNILTGCDAASGVCTIAPTTALPTITEAVTIDGYTQPGASANTLAEGCNFRLLIQLSGEYAPDFNQWAYLHNQWKRCARTGHQPL